MQVMRHQFMQLSSKLQSIEPTSPSESEGFEPVESVESSTASQTGIRTSAFDRKTEFIRSTDSNEEQHNDGVQKTENVDYNHLYNGNADNKNTSADSKSVLTFTTPPITMDSIFSGYVLIKSRRIKYSVVKLESSGILIDLLVDVVHRQFVRIKVVPGLNLIELLRVWDLKFSCLCRRKFSSSTVADVQNGDSIIAVEEKLSFFSRKVCSLVQRIIDCCSLVADSLHVNDEKLDLICKKELDVYQHHAACTIQTAYRTHYDKSNHLLHGKREVLALQSLIADCHQSPSSNKKKAQRLKRLRDRFFINWFELLSMFSTQR